MDLAQADPTGSRPIPSRPLSPIVGAPSEMAVNPPPGRFAATPRNAPKAQAPFDGVTFTVTFSPSRRTRTGASSPGLTKLAAACVSSAESVQRPSISSGTQVSSRSRG